jgi:hypothetical protein
MPPSSSVLVAILTAAFVGFVIFGVTSFGASPGDVAMMVGFGLVLVLAAYVALTAKRARQPVAGRYGLPRIVWVIFASYAAAIALAMLLAMLVIPWVGLKGVEYFFGPEHTWAVIVLGVILFPFVRRRLS